MELCACQKEIKVVSLCQLQLTHTHTTLASRESVLGPSVSCGDRGSPFLALCLLHPGCTPYKHRGEPSVCKAPSRPQGRKDAKSGLGLLMHVVWAQRPARACGKSYGGSQPLKLLEKASTQPSPELWCLSPLVSAYVLGAKSVNKVTQARLYDRQQWSSSLNNSADCFSYSKSRTHILPSCHG